MLLLIVDSIHACFIDFILKHFVWLRERPKIIEPSTTSMRFHSFLLQDRTHTHATIIKLVESYAMKIIKEHKRNPVEPIKTSKKFNAKWTQEILRATYMSESFLFCASHLLVYILARGRVAQKVIFSMGHEEKRLSAQMIVHTGRRRSLR